MRRSPNCGQSSLHRQQRPGALLTVSTRRRARTRYLFAYDAGLVSTCEGSCASAASIGNHCRPGGSRQLTHPENPLHVLDSAGAAVVVSQQRGGNGEGYGY
jgi:hypothetical protein